MPNKEPPKKHLKAPTKAPVTPKQKPICRPVSKTAAEKKCEAFCKNDYLPKREKVEKNVHPKSVPLNIYPDPFFKATLKNLYVKSCHDIYCRPGCGKKPPQDFLPTFQVARRNDLKSRGARSGCRDLTREFPKNYRVSDGF